MLTSGGNYDVNFNGAIFVVGDSGSVLNILIFRYTSRGNLCRKAVSMLIQTMENNEEILQALHGKSDTKDSAYKNKNGGRIF